MSVDSTPRHGVRRAKTDEFSTGTRLAEGMLMHRASLLLVALVGLFGCSETTEDQSPLDTPTADRGFETTVDAGGGGLTAEVPATDGGGMKADGGTCTPDLTGIVRDFKDDHPDFENDAFMSDDGETGIVDAVLGADFKPVYARKDGTHSRLTTGKTQFDQWYRDVAGINQQIPLKLTLTKGEGGVMTYENLDFFPIDGRGFGNQGREHNFHFTFELHTEFAYHGGEVFKFFGDDDLWVFVNQQLAIDLGGLHPSLPATIRLDELKAKLGLETGKTYELAVFQAERHTTASRFRIDTTIEFTNCAPIIK